MAIADAIAIVRKGEQVDLYGTWTAATGTIQITGQPTASLYKSDGAAVFAGENTSGHDSAAAATVNVWKRVDTNLPTAGAQPLAVGFYTLKLTATVAGRVELRAIVMKVID